MTAKHIDWQSRAEAAELANAALAARVKVLELACQTVIDSHDENAIACISSGCACGNCETLRTAIGESE